jgi:hypothetical protein
MMSQRNDRNDRLNILDMQINELTCNAQLGVVSVENSRYLLYEAIARRSALICIWSCQELVPKPPERAA